MRKLLLFMWCFICVLPAAARPAGQFKLALWEWAAGAFNYACNLRDVQLGVVNYSDYIKGVQWGLINICPHAFVPAMMFINGRFEVVY